MHAWEMTNSALLAQLRGGAGIVAALDQSGGSTADALASYGVAKESWSSDAEMFALIHRMRERVMTAARFDGRQIIAAILFEGTLDHRIQGRTVPAYLRSRGIASFLKIGAGLESESDGVQLLKPISSLDALFERARSLGVIGTKMRSVIHRANAAGVAAVVEQQFALAEQIAAVGLLPILEPEVSIAAVDRASVEDALAGAIISRLDALTGDRQVVLKLTIPERADTYAALAGHHRVVRVLALSGGFTRSEACHRLAFNHGMIASFSRALLENLDHRMNDLAFNGALGEAIDQAYAASTLKHAGA